MTLQDRVHAPDVQKVDNAIQRINLYPLDRAICIFLILIHWIVISQTSPVGVELFSYVMLFLLFQ